MKGNIPKVGEGRGYQTVSLEYAKLSASPSHIYGSVHILPALMNSLVLKVSIFFMRLVLNFL